MNLYRIMADVSAGSNQLDAARGDFGVVTLWIRAESDYVALARADAVLANRAYASIGTVRLYVEELADDPFGCKTAEERAADRSEDPVVAAYDTIKERALAHADGLHEIWLGGLADQLTSRRVS